MHCRLVPVHQSGSFNILKCVMCLSFEDCTHQNPTTCICPSKVNTVSRPKTTNLLLR